MIFNNAAFVGSVASMCVGATACALGAPWYPVGLAVFLGSLMLLGALLERGEWLRLPRLMRDGPPRIYWIVPLWFVGLVGLSTLCYEAGPRWLGMLLFGACGVMVVLSIQRHSRQPGGHWLVTAAFAMGAQICVELAEDRGHRIWGQGVVRPALAILILASLVIFGFVRHYARVAPPPRAPDELPRARIN